MVGRYVEPGRRVLGGVAWVQELLRGGFGRGHAPQNPDSCGRDGVPTRQAHLQRRAVRSFPRRRRLDLAAEVARRETTATGRGPALVGFCRCYVRPLPRGPA